MSEKNNVFQTLNSIDVSSKVEKKDNLDYLSWAWAWAETKKVYPNAKYDILRNEQGLPFFYDENLGYMVFTWVEIEGIRYDMWLYVKDGKNKAMKNKPYTYNTKYKKDIRVEQATMADINNTLMRCLTKNLAMHGLGLYIYAGEDLPEDTKYNSQWNTIKVKSEDSKQICKWLRDKYNKNFDEALTGLKAYNIKHFNDLDLEENKPRVAIIKQMMAIGNK